MLDPRARADGPRPRTRERHVQQQRCWPGIITRIVISGTSESTAGPPGGFRRPPLLCCNQKPSRIRPGQSLNDALTTRWTRPSGRVREPCQRIALSVTWDPRRPPWCYLSGYASSGELNRDRLSVTVVNAGLRLHENGGEDCTRYPGVFMQRLPRPPEPPSGRGVVARLLGRSQRPFWERKGWFPRALK